MTTPSETLLTALRTADSTPLPALATFDALVGAPDPLPDFLEWSAHIASGCDAARLTYYFDAARHTPHEMTAVGDRFAALTTALGVPVPAALLQAYAAHVPGSDDVLQVVIGIDERPGAARRAKLYVIMRRAAPALVDALLGSVAVARPDSLDPGRVYILGLDLGTAGLVDAKLYYRLEIARMPRVVANLSEVRDVFGATRDVVMQRCLLSERSQMYLHADNPNVIARLLERQARTSPAAAQLVARHAAVREALARGRIEPWIISFGFRDHRLQLGASNVYYHYGE